MNKCQSCGKYFHPHPRLGKRQKICGCLQCKKKYQKRYQKIWRVKNPDIFKNRYDYVKAWRNKNPKYQRLWRKKQREIQNSISPATSVKTLSIVVPAKVFEGEIQNSICLVRQCSCGLWFAGNDREIQNSIGNSST